MIPRKSLFLVALSTIMLLSYNCKETSKNTSAQAEDAEQLADPKADIADPNIQWQLIVNAQLDSLYPMYMEEAYKISAKGEMVKGNMRIMDLYKGKGLVINEIEASKRITAVLDSTVIYEIGNFSNPDRNSYAHLIIWRKEGGEMRRELELVKERNPGTPIPPILEKRRAKWMELCNAHKVSDLVNEMYTKNTLYYNHRPMVVGREAVIKEYDYMNDPQYQLKLEPITIEAVNDDLVFEIGQCSGSYPGNYVLVWSKDVDGLWRILLDANI